MFIYTECWWLFTDPTWGYCASHIFFWRRALKNSNHRGAIIQQFPSAQARQCLSALSYRHCLLRCVFGATPMTAPLRLSVEKRVNHRHMWLWSFCRDSFGACACAPHILCLQLSGQSGRCQMTGWWNWILKISISKEFLCGNVKEWGFLCNSTALLSALDLSRRSWVFSTLNLH